MKSTFSLSFTKMDLATFELPWKLLHLVLLDWFPWMGRWNSSFWISKHNFFSGCYASKLCVVDSSAKFYSLMGTFACGLFNLSSSNRLLVNIWAKFFSPMGPLPVAFLILVLPMDCWKYLDLLILVLFESSFYTTGTSHVSLVMDREWLPPLEQ